MPENEYPTNSTQDDTSGWDPEAALKSLADEDLVYGDVQPKDAANRIFRDALPMAAKAITHLARSSRNEQLRFRAAQYVVERNIGKLTELGDMSPREGDANPLESLLGNVVKEVNKVEAGANGEYEA